MCRVYGSGSSKYVRLCKQTKYQGWQLYFTGDAPLSSSGHVRIAEALNSGKYVLRPPTKDKRPHAPKGFQNR